MTVPIHRPAPTNPAGRDVVVAFGDEVVVGGHAVPVIAPSGMGGDVAHAVAQAGTVADADAVGAARAGIILDVARRRYTADPVGPAPAADPGDAAEAATRPAAGIVVDDPTGLDRACVTAARRAGTPVVLRLAGRGADAGLAEGEVDVSEGDVDAVLVDVERAHEVGGLRQRFGAPVLVRLGAGAAAGGCGGGGQGRGGAGAGVLAGVAIAAGADALWLAGAVSPADVAQVREAVTRLAPLVRPAAPATVAGCREVVDGVDAAIATLLEYRVGLAGRIQQLKPVGGYAGRDSTREAEIVTAMSRRAPSLSRGAMKSIMAAVIEAGLEAAARARDDEPPVWRG